MKQVYDFGRRIREMADAIKRGVIKPELLDKNAPDDELGEPDDKVVKAKSE